MDITHLLQGKGMLAYQYLLNILISDNRTLGRNRNTEKNHEKFLNE